MRIGLDVGSTTLKCVAIDDNDNIIFKNYLRHFSQITVKSAELLNKIISQHPGLTTASIVVSGSAGMGFAQQLGLPFVQEVYATRTAVQKLLPGTDAVIELGGEDAKILFFTGGTEVRMNGSCAGGTGAFIDQMAALLGVETADMDTLAEESEKIYTIASRCGVFAKSDIQPLLNQGAKKTDIAASIFKAVVNQTVAGLSQGRPIAGNVVYLGGPLTFLPQLRKSFDETLGLKGSCPENSLYYVSIGAALSPEAGTVDIGKTVDKIAAYTSDKGYISCLPLFSSEDEYKEFKARHDKETVKVNENAGESDRLFLGIDAGSTTIKCAVINSDSEIVFSRYMSNSGNPIPAVKEFLTEFYNKYPGCKIEYSAVTGYGEEIVKNAFNADIGVVETIAHYTAAKKFRPDVDFIIDIGGQDIKCFKIRNGAIDNIFLNEACSSGCGSFLQSFAQAWNCSIAEFADLGLFADKPVDLGSRCTVFMNSSVKQAQKDGASKENISAGLSVSVIKNALYKVIRASGADDLGKNIVVQGGTFLNDAVLRAFEKEIGRDVVRPDISGLMGAYGAAIYAMDRSKGESSILTLADLNSFEHSVKAITCAGCPNACRLTVNTFSGGRRYIGGNKCSKPLTGNKNKVTYNLYDYKKELLSSYQPVKGKRGTVGIPMGLNMYELLPFWHTFFTKLGYEVTVSPESTRQTYLDGQHSIPSDTVCYPAKLMHGHIEYLVKQGIKNIFYPCMTYNIDEGLGDNNYNCPVVAYYPEVIRSNSALTGGINFIWDYVGIHRRNDFIPRIHRIVCERLEKISLREIEGAVNAAYDEYEAYMAKIRRKGDEFISLAKKKNLPVIILCGRPYHLDSEINHGIDKLICECGAVVVTEDSISEHIEKFATNVLDQWTYQSRLYAAAKYVADSNDSKINLVQLVSFGCGTDAITTDEVRSILEEKGKIYTQIKIDEITNLGAVKIRLRSLFAALGLE
ncbi:MAG: acyl-CoA dehydratase activase [Clostridia bacterium]|nr:acyl-CoA dehydratase activase [Clostridia bacterium]